MPPNLTYRFVGFHFLKNVFYFYLLLERSVLNLRARLRSLRFNKCIWLAFTGVSSDPPSGCALSARSFALGGRSKLRPGPIGSISRRKPHRAYSLGIQPEQSGYVLHCPSLVEYSWSDSADSRCGSIRGR